MCERGNGANRGRGGEERGEGRRSRRGGRGEKGGGQEGELQEGFYYVRTDDDRKERATGLVCQGKQLLSLQKGTGGWEGKGRPLGEGGGQDQARDQAGDQARDQEAKQQQKQQKRKSSKQKRQQQALGSAITRMYQRVCWGCRTGASSTCSR